MSFQNTVVILLFVICTWMVVNLVVGLISGWSELARNYRATQGFVGRSWRFQSARFRWLTGYNNVLTVGANPQGLYLAVFPLFRIGHPPLFIPWQDVSVRPGRTLGFDIYKLDFRQAPSIHLQVRQSLGKRIGDAAGSAWPGDRGKAGSAS
jgi:hypothetical protein